MSEIQILPEDFTAFFLVALSYVVSGWARSAPRHMIRFQFMFWVWQADYSWLFRENPSVFFDIRTDNTFWRRISTCQVGEKNTESWSLCRTSGIKFKWQNSFRSILFFGYLKAHLRYQIEDSVSDIVCVGRRIFLDFCERSLSVP